MAYVPANTKDLRWVVCWPESPTKEEKSVLIKILNNYIGGTGRTTDGGDLQSQVDSLGGLSRGGEESGDGEIGHLNGGEGYTPEAEDNPFL